MPSPRSEDYIRELCARAVKAEHCDLEPILEELKTALHEHTERLRKLAFETLSPARKFKTASSES